MFLNDRHICNLRLIFKIKSFKLLLFSLFLLFLILQCKHGCFHKMLIGIVKRFVKILVKLHGGDVTSIWKFGRGGCVFLEGLRSILHFERKSVSEKELDC